jgi:plastocyanin domain-containing protein
VWRVKIKMKNIWIIILAIILIAGLGIFFIKSSSSTDSITGGSGGDSFQKITLSMKNANYYPQTITVKVNEPVRIYLDSSVTGCYRAFTINEFGVSKYLEYPTDYVEFTPTKKGSFKFACSMGMGTGTLIVE